MTTEEKEVRCKCGNLIGYERKVASSPVPLLVVNGIITDKLYGVCEKRGRVFDHSISAKLMLKLLQRMGCKVQPGEISAST